MMYTVKQHMLKILENLTNGQSNSSGPPVLLNVTGSKEEFVSNALLPLEGNVWHTVQLDVSSLMEDDSSEEEQKKLIFLLERITDDSNVWDLLKSKNNECPNICIGRTQRNDVIVPDRTISSIHAQVERLKNGVYLIDCNSSNGTFIEGRRIKSRVSHLLRDGDCVRFGKCVFYFVEGDSLRKLIKMRLAKRITAITTGNNQCSQAVARSL